MNGSTAPTLTGVSSGPFSNTSFIYLGTVSGFSSNANNIVYQFASIQSGQAATSNYNLNQITNYTAAASIQSAPAANLNQTINFINSTIVYVSQGPMNFSIGNNFVFTATTTGTGNTSITFSGTSSGAGNNSLTGSSFVVSSTSQTATIISSSSASLLSSSSSTTYTSTLNQIPIAYKTGASMQGLINTHVIFYGAAFRNYFTNNNKAIIQNFLANVYGSNWYAVAMKYGVGRVMMGQSIFIDCQNQTTGFGCAITSANVQALVWAQIGSTLPMDPKALYLVVAAPEVIEAADPTNSSSPSLGQSYCGYHNFIYSNVFDTFKYALVGVPNLLSINMTGIVTAGSIPNIIKPASKCVYAMINPSNASPNGDVQVDMSISIIAHELIECIISPVAMQTWADANNQEGKGETGGYIEVVFYNFSHPFNTSLELLYSNGQIF